MAWVSPKVYAILSQSEEGKDIIERLPDLTQEECQEELDAFFGDGGKGASSGNDYLKAKKDDEFEENAYRNSDIDYSKDLEENDDLFDDYDLATEKAVNKKNDFLKKKGIDDVHKLSNEEFGNLAKELGNELNIKQELAEELLVSEKGNDDDLPWWDKPDEDEEKVFKPTEKTIWDDMEHPLYGIPPSEQNENYLSEAIQEMEKYSRNWNTMSRRDKSNISPGGKKYLEMNLNRYKKALEYIKNGGK